MSIVLLDVSTRAKRKLTFPPSKSMGDSMPSFSPDGSETCLREKSCGCRARSVYVPVTGANPGGDRTEPVDPRDDLGA